ncbi:unnamed protein product [Phytophthora fragariaefolia]|uniref:Unnamed protein product n=1 Tax=Phytophthora fragariaefolia TaxID=1490495 RepID=A0A9W6XTN3_9STRA|nr:unnamed protein product [Phytophthora fragariaefolia]
MYVAGHPGYAWEGRSREGGEVGATFMGPSRDMTPFKGKEGVDTFGRLFCLSFFAATDVSVKSGDFVGPDGFLGIRGKCPAKTKSSAASHSKEDAAGLWTLSEDCKFEVRK